MSINLPKYTKKPNDKRGEVIATNIGWEVVLPSGKREVLWCVKNLDKKIKEIEQTLSDNIDLQDAVDLKNLINGDLKLSKEDKDKIDKEIFKSKPQKRKKRKAKSKDTE